MSALFISFLLMIAPAIGDTVLQPASVSAVKQSISMERLASPSSTLGMPEMNNFGIVGQAAFASAVPGIYIPEYGASLTSSIYVRGFGSRMENPVVGFYIDDIPILDKNAYDFDWEAIRSASFLRGPQGTLYGRNSMCGILSVSTMSAADLESPVLMAEYGTANSVRLSAMAAKGGSLFNLAFRRSDGFWRNGYDGRMCDPYIGGSLGWKWTGPQKNKMQAANSLRIFVSREGGFAYGAYNDGTRAAVNYNDEGSYGRISILDGFKTHFEGERLKLDAIASVQLLSDRMLMDQDYTPESIFTLEQRQRSAALSFELIARPVRRYAHWTPQSGLFAFAKGNLMHAPVVFKRGGIEKLILNNANSNIPGSIGHLEIAEDSFDVNSDFGIFTWDAALYHESVFTYGRWTFTAGLRLEMEGASMDYDSGATVNYRFVPIMTGHKEFTTDYEGIISHAWLVFLPKVSALYDLPLPDPAWRLKLYATAAKGFRAGGFNTQIFSDILQNMMMTGLMDDLGVHLDRPSVSVGAKNTEYKPEEALSFEIGARIHHSHSLKAEFCAFLMQGRNQQMTVFPPGMSTGRMMANAGRSHSYGTEAELNWHQGRFHAIINGSWAEARFSDYNDGNNDYRGKRIPYSPRFTVFAGAGYDFPVSDCILSLNADIRGAGPFEWNEANSIHEPFTPVFGGRISLSDNGKEFYVRAENVTNASYNTFYFKSMGNEFLAAAKPARIYIGIRIKL